MIIYMSTLDIATGVQAATQLEDTYTVPARSPESIPWLFASLIIAFCSFFTR